MRRHHAAVFIGVVAFPALVGGVALLQQKTSSTAPSTLSDKKTVSQTTDGSIAPIIEQMRQNASALAEPVVGPIMSGTGGSGIDNPEALADEILRWEESRRNDAAETTPDQEGVIRVRPRPKLGLIEIERETGGPIIGPVARREVAIFHLRLDEYASVAQSMNSQSPGQEALGLRQALGPFSSAPDEFMAMTEPPNYMVTIYKDGQESHTIYYWQLSEGEEAKADPNSLSFVAIYKNGRVVVVERSGRKADTDPPLAPQSLRGQKYERARVL